MYCLALLLVVPAQAAALNLGVFAYRPKQVLEERYQPLAHYLSAQLGSVDVRLLVLDQDEMEKALAAKQLDLVFTNPSHYTLLRSQNNLTGALATLVSMESGHATSSLGGLIIARSDKARGTDLEQLRGSTIGAPGVKFLGGYQTQAFELFQLGIELPRDARVEILKSHDEVVQAVLGGRVDYGFVRTGILEDMTREGKLDPLRLTVLNAQRPPGFPYKVSTRLYPEWAFVALPHVDSRQVRKIASSLMALEESSPVAQAAGIGGFSPPGDYLPVENLARTLRLPPFDARQPIRLSDVWQRWQGLWIGLILSITLFTTLAAMQMRRRNDELLALQAEQLRAESRLRENEQHFRNLANSGSALLWTSGLDKHCDFFNEPWLRFTGRTLEQELGEGWLQGLHPEDRDTRLTTYARAFDERTSFDLEYRLRRADGVYRWLHDEGRPRFDSDGRFIGYIGHCYDVTERREAARQLTLAANVFTSAHEGILISDPHGVIVDVNQAFTEITGYSPKEAVGRNASLLKSGSQGPDFYARMWQQLLSSGHWSGEIWNRRKNGEFFAENLTISAVAGRQGQVEHYVGLFSDITPQKQQQKQLERLAHFDALTGLPNRVLLADRLNQAMSQARRRGTRLVVAVIDLDGFKLVNDRHGHQVGDDVLRVVAERMHEALREADTVARIGGDEFVAVISDLEQDHDCLPMIQRLQEATARTVNLGDEVVQVSGSIGFTFYPQLEEIEADQLLRQADQAMYQAKLSGKNRYHVFDADLDRHVRSRHESLEEIRQALEDGQFVLHYQPKVNMRDGKVVGVEALLRWQHPSRGMLSPIAFLYKVDKHPLELELGRWVVDTALRQLEAWSRRGFHVAVSVNISAAHLQQESFVARLRQQLLAHPRVSPGSLLLEVLETSALGDIRKVSEIIRACAELGVGFSLDDFGTGYSSLTYLKHLPVKEIKIDQSFVRDMLHDPEDLAILLGVRGLAQAFRKRIIAEGVETELHGSMLLRLGCELGQGYGIARPMPADDIPAWAAQWRPPASWAHTRPLPGESLPILYAGVEHRAWMKALEAHLSGERDPLHAFLPGGCRFGEWLHGLQASEVDDFTRHRIRKLDEVHQDIHRLARDLLGPDMRSPKDAQSLHAQIHERSRELQRLLDSLNSIGDMPIAAQA